MQEKKMQKPMQNMQTMREKPSKEDHSINIVRQSGISMGEDKGKRPENKGWVHKATEKEVEFDLNRAQENFIEAKKNFVEAFTLGSQEKPVEEMYPSMITTFLGTCMKLLHDSKVLKGLHELIKWCVGKDNATGELHIVRKLGKHKARTRHGMRLTT